MQPVPTIPIAVVDSVFIALLVATVVVAIRFVIDLRPESGCCEMGSWELITASHRSSE